MLWLAGIACDEKSKPMSGETYRRIIKGYHPIEPTSFFEKAFYLLWLPVYVFQLILMRFRLYRSKGSSST